MSLGDKSYIGVGKVHIKRYGIDEAWRHVGNVSNATLAHALDIKKQPDYTRLGGGTRKQVERIQSVTCNMTWLSFLSANFALATAGNVTAVALSASTVEDAASFKDSHVPLAKPPSTITSVVSKPSGTTYAAGTDFELSPGGLYIPAGSTIPNATVTNGVATKNITVTYASPAHEIVEAAVRTSTELAVRIEGLNEADSGAPVLIDIWRMSLPPAAQLALISGEFGELAVAAEVLKDSTKGAGVSAMYRTIFV